MEPAIVLTRFLDALAVLDSTAHQNLTRVGSRYAAIPPPAIRDALHRWWQSPAATILIEEIFAAINGAVLPSGFVCSFASGDRFEIVRADRVGRPGDAATSRPPPSVSALRFRVRPQ